MALAVIAGDAVVAGAGPWLTDWPPHMCRHSEPCRGVDVTFISLLVAGPKFSKVTKEKQKQAVTNG
jgi:hypothetical protein